MHRSAKPCFSGHQANKFHCKGISWFKHRPNFKMLKNFACGTDSALIAEVLVWPPLSTLAKLQVQNHLHVHLCIKSDAHLFEVTDYQCVRSSTLHTINGVIDVFRHNITWTMWHFSCTLLNRQVK